MSILSIDKLRRLSLGFPTLDDVFTGFELGDFVVIRGNATSFMLSVLSVRAQLPIESGGLASSTVFVDGGNSFSPYEVAETARDYGLDCRTVLNKVYVSRAFTAYQLSSLVLDKVCLVLQKTRTKLLIVSDITALFLDRDMPKLDGRELFLNLCSKLSGIAVEKQTVVVVSCFQRNLSSQSLFFEAALFGKSNILIKLKKKGQVMSVSLEDHPYVKPFRIDLAVDPQYSYARAYGGAGFG
jgi:hypothetical protein